MPAAARTSRCRSMRFARRLRARTCAGTARHWLTCRSNATGECAACHSHVRFALLLALVGCAGAPKKPPLDLLDEEAFHPPAATFRWALHPVTCDHDLRSTVDTCAGRDAADEHLVAVYAPVDDHESQVVILRYDGPHVGAPLRWQHKVDFGPAPHSATITIVRDTAITAVVSNGAARVVAIDNQTGRLMGTATIVESGSISVQVEGISDYARIHVLTT